MLETSTHPKHTIGVQSSYTPYRKRDSSRFQTDKTCNPQLRVNSTLAKATYGRERTYSCPKLSLQTNVGEEVSRLREHLDLVADSLTENQTKTHPLVMSLDAVNPEADEVKTWIFQQASVVYFLVPAQE